MRNILVLKRLKIKSTFGVPVQLVKRNFPVPKVLLYVIRCLDGSSRRHSRKRKSN